MDAFVLSGSGKTVMYTSEHLIADTCDRIDPVHFIARYECLVKSMFSYVYASRTPSSGSRHWPHPVSRLTPWAGSAGPGSSQQATPSPLQISTPVIAGQPAQEGMYTPGICHFNQLIPASRAPHNRSDIHRAHYTDKMAHTCKSCCRNGCWISAARSASSGIDAPCPLAIEDTGTDAERAEGA